MWRLRRRIGRRPWPLAGQHRADAQHEQQRSAARGRTPTAASSAAGRTAAAGHHLPGSELHGRCALPACRARNRVHCGFGFRASSFWTIIRNSRARTAVASVFDDPSRTDRSAGAFGDSAMGFLQRVGGRDTRRNHRPPQRSSLRAGKSVPSLCQSMRRLSSARKASAASWVCKSHRMVWPPANTRLRFAGLAWLIRTRSLIVKLQLFWSRMEPPGGAKRMDSAVCHGHDRPVVGRGAKPRNPLWDGARVRI